MGMCACESLQDSLDLHGNVQWAIANEFHDPLYTAFQGFPQFSEGTDDLLERINEYIGRNLTYESDMLNALMGIMRHAWYRKMYPIYSLYGLPFSRISPNTLGVKFINALYWGPPFDTELRVRLRHRYDFPSWTWAGWQGLEAIEKRFSSRWTMTANADPRFEDLSGE